MNIKYNDRGEVMSVNGLATGHHMGTPMQDAIGTPSDNQLYATENGTVTNCENTIDDHLPEKTGGAFVATITGTVAEGSEVPTWSIDKTFAEIVDALKASRAVSANMVLTFGETSIFVSNGAVFCMTIGSEGEVGITFYVTNIANDVAELAPVGRFTLSYSDMLTCDALNMA